MFRTYSGSFNSDIESLVFVDGVGTGSIGKPISTTTPPTFVTTSCTLVIGDTTEGITGTVTDFRLWAGTGAIAGMTDITAQNCDVSVGLSKGTHYPCVASCSDTNCISCTTSTICEACNSATYLLNNGANPAYCVTSCPYGAITDSTNRVCTICSLTGKYVSSNTCVATCPEGYGTDSSNVCISCTASSKVSYNNQCVSTCPAGYGKDASSNCVACTTTYSYNGVCTATCPTGWGAQTSPRSCIDCSLSSKYSYNNLCTATCPAGWGATTSPNACISCTASSKVSYNNQCVSTCPAGYGNSSSNCVACTTTYSYNGVCTATCPTGWGAETSPRSCVSCAASSKVSYNNQCVSTCPAGYGKDASSNCVACTTTYSYNGVCTATCPTGWGAQTSPRSCIDCSLSSKYSYNNLCTATCPAAWGATTSPNACVSCAASSKVSYNNQCVSTCPAGYGNSSSNCAACTTTYSYNGVCTATCPTGWGAQTSPRSCIDCSLSSKYSYNNLCTATCPAGWGAKTSPNVCISCAASSKVSYNNQCVSTCPTGYGKDGSSNCVVCSGSTYSHNGVCTANCPGGWGGTTSPNACVSCSASSKVSYGNLCVDSCPPGYTADSSSNCIDCSASSKYAHNGVCVSTCPGGWGGTTTPSVCISCVASGKVSHNNLCVANCPTGWGLDSTSNCVDCSLNGTYSYKYTCVEDCPYGYIENSTLHSCEKCPQWLYYFNHTCLASCPNKTFANSTVYECQPCYLGCESCLDSTNTTCTACSVGYFLNGGYCGSGCPSTKYANPDTRACEPCQPPCVTCHQPNNLSCTSCPADYYLLDGTCVTSCPITHYESFLGNASSFRVPACLRRLGLVFKLALSSQARTVYINFNYSITDIIQAVAQLIKIEIGSVEIDSASYVLTPLTDSIIKFQYIGDQYYPSLSVLTVTLDLQSSFNYDPYQKFRSITKSATIKLKEIYSFSPAEIQVIGTTANFTGVGGATFSGGQAASSVAGGALSLSLVRMQIIGEIVQLLRFIDILWPPNIQDLFSNTKYDPNSIVIQIDLIQSWNQYLEDRNTTMPRAFEAYEVGPFFTDNYNAEMSNIFVLSIITVFGFVMTSFLRKKLQAFTANHKLPKTNAVRSFRDRLVRFLHSLSRLLNRFDPTIFWNFALLFTLAIFQPGVFWSLININYYSTVVEPHTPYTKATLAFAVITLLLYLSLMAFVFYAVISNLKYLLDTKESLRPLHIKPYRNLFEDFDCQSKLQLLFVPISMVKSLLYAMTLVFLTDSPIAQIIIIWGLSAAFIAYMIIKRPLKDKWTRIITLVVELFGFGCMSIGFVLSLIEKAVELDASTRDEIGFVFIAFTITSTLAGGLLAFIQVLALVIDIYKYIKEKVQRRRQVKPLSLEELCAESPHIPQISSRKTIHITGRGETTVRVNSETILSKPNLSMDLDKYIGGLSTQVLSQSPRGMQLLENIKIYSQDHPSTGDHTTNDMIPLRDEKKRIITFTEGRVPLFNEN